MPSWYQNVDFQINTREQPNRQPEARTKRATQGATSPTTQNPFRTASQRANQKTAQRTNPRSSPEDKARSNSSSNPQEQPKELPKPHPPDESKKQLGHPPVHPRNPELGPWSQLWVSYKQPKQPNWWLLGHMVRGERRRRCTPTVYGVLLSTCPRVRVRQLLPVRQLP